MEVVKAYLNGEGGYNYLMDKYHISSTRRIADWVASYNHFGEEGLLRKRQDTNYSLDFKLKVIEYYLTTEISYQDLAIIFGINNPSLLNSWVSKFRKEGVEGLSKPKGWPPKMKSKEEKENIVDNYTEINVNESERIKELEKQVRYLEIENAYLKELRRLRLEEIRVTREQQESSTTSEDHSG